MKFKYLKGSEADFDGAPKWATHKIINPNRGLLKSFGSNKLYWWYAESDKDSIAYYQTGDDVSSKHLSFSVHRTGFEIIAQREPIAEPEKLGHGLDCEECKPREGKVFADFFVPAFRNYANELFSTKNNTQSPSRTEEKMANITMNVTVDDIKPVIDKIISDLAKEPIELSLQIVNGRPVISDQFGRVLENQITGVEFGINSKLPPQVTISVKFKEIK